jgi:hypothetical protein
MIYQLKMEWIFRAPIEANTLEEAKLKMGKMIKKTSFNAMTAEYYAKQIEQIK